MRAIDQGPDDASPGRRNACDASGSTVDVLVSLVTRAARSRTQARPNELDNVIYDTAAADGAAACDSDDIIIVAIDQESLGRIGRWPWPRAIHARLLEQLAKGHPLRDVIHDVLFNDSGDMAAGDAALGAAIAAASPVYLPILFRVPGRNGRGYDALPPASVIADSARLGHAAINPDRDGVVRRVDLQLDGLRRWKHIVAMAIARPARGIPEAPRTMLRREDTIMVTFGGAPRPNTRTVPFADVLDGRLPPEFLRDKYVLVGATAPGLGDQYSTPVTGDIGVMSGIEIQANLLDTLITGTTVRPASAIAQAGLALVAIWLLLATFLVLPPQRGALAGVVLLVVVLAFCLGLLRIGHIWLPPAAALIGLVAVLPLWAWRRLAAVSDYMRAELELLAGEPELFAAASPAPPVGGDPVARQIGLLSVTIARVQRLRQLVSAAIHELPDATVRCPDSTARSSWSMPPLSPLFGTSITPDSIHATFAGEPPLPAFAPSSACRARPPPGRPNARRATDRCAKSARSPGATTMAWRWGGLSGSATSPRCAAPKPAARRRCSLLTHDMRAPQAIDPRAAGPVARARRGEHEGPHCALCAAHDRARRQVPAARAPKPAAMRWMRSTSPTSSSKRSMISGRNRRARTSPSPPAAPIARR